MIYVPPPTIAQAKAKIVEITQATTVNHCHRWKHDRRKVTCTANGGPQLGNYDPPLVRATVRRGKRGNWTFVVVA